MAASLYLRKGLFLYLLVFVFVSLSRCNLHTLRITLYKCISWWVLTNVYSDINTININIEYLYYPQNIPSAPATSSFLTLCPGNHWSVFCPILLPFSECRINRIIQYKALCIWLLSLSNMHLRFIYIMCVWVVCCLLLLSSILYYGCTTICLLIHQLMSIWVVSNLWLLWIKLTRISICRLHGNYVFIFLR